MIRLAVIPGKILLFLAGMALLTGISFFVVGAYLASWPIMRVSPRNRRMQALMGLAVSVMAVARAYDLDKIPGRATEDREATERDIVNRMADEANA